MDNKSAKNTVGLQPYLSPIAVWAFSVGSAIGWGSLIVTNTNYISQAGPLGSIIGLLIGIAMMLMVASHYHFLSARYPEAGGLYNYIKNIFGYDRAFLVAWYLFLVYISVFWANATSVPLFARYFLHGIFSFGHLYTVFGYDVYLGEVIITLAVIVIIALISMYSNKLTARIMTALAFIFVIGISVCFAVAMIKHPSSGMTMKPAFIPDASHLRQITHIAFISPWAFIGFESVSHYSEEYKFTHKKLFNILLVSLIVITALYIFLVVLSVSAYPEGCSSWLDYITHLDDYEGIEGLPAFYAAHHYLGQSGVYILMASLVALVFSSLIGMMRALSRLCYGVAQDGILSKAFTKLNKKNIPYNTILLVLIVSLPIPFLGRTAIGWIVDTTTFGSTIIYGFASIAVFKASREEKCRKDIILSSICLVILALFLFYLLFPGLFSDHTIETESYALMIAWSLLGLLFFNRVIKKDHARNFGKAIIVWIALLIFMVIMLMTLVQRINESRQNDVINTIQSHYYDDEDNESSKKTDDFFEDQRQALSSISNVSSLIIIFIFGTSIAVLYSNYRSMRKWESIASAERDHARTIAFTDTLTGVKSKHAFEEQEAIIDYQIEEGTLEEFGLIVCDVNGLKRINDTLGHKAGDKYICCSCNMLCEYFAHSPVFRIGGDEFVILLEGRDYKSRNEIIDDINRVIEENIGTDSVVISLGLAEYNSETDKNIHDVFKRADALMYERKKQLKSMGAVIRE